jgi:SAM-dependent methyltransferase
VTSAIGSTEHSDVTSFNLKRRVKTALRALLAETPLLPRRAPFEPPLDDDEAVTPSTPCPSGPILTLEGCAACGAVETTLVAEFNRFALAPTSPDADAARYDYRLCHHCGIIYASRRPGGERYRWLFEHFEETLGRDDRSPGAGPAAKMTLSAFSLTEGERDEIRRRAAHGVFVSDHHGLGRKEYLPSLLADRLANSIHAEVLGSLIQERAHRVLEIRSRAGSIGASLRRQLDADVSVMALFENQRFAIEQAYGFRAEALLDFDAFAIPYETTFDVVIANHMFTHVVRPRDYFAEVRRHLRPGGYLYLYNEPDDAEYLLEGKSMFNTLNAFHLQAFDGRSLTRALAANGFRVSFLTRHDGHFLCLCTLDEHAEWTPMSEKELGRRTTRYLQARDAAIVKMPPHARALVGSEWDRAVDRAFKNGRAEVREDGEVRVRR